MIIVAWIIVGLFAVASLWAIICAFVEDWKFFTTLLGLCVAVGALFVSLVYINYYYRKPESPQTSDAIAQSSTNWMGVPITTWGTNDETLQLGLAPNGAVVWRRVDTNIW